MRDSLGILRAKILYRSVRVSRFARYSLRSRMLVVSSRDPVYFLSGHVLGLLLRCYSLLKPLYMAGNELTPRSSLAENPSSADEVLFSSFRVFLVRCSRDTCNRRCILVWKGKEA